MAKAKQKSPSRPPRPRRQPMKPAIDDSADLFDYVPRKEFEKACRDGEAAIGQLETAIGKLADIIELLNQRASNQQAHLEYHCQGISLVIKGLLQLKQGQETAPPNPPKPQPAAVPADGPLQHVAALRFPKSDLLGIALIRDGQKYQLRNRSSAEMFLGKATAAPGDDVILDIYKRV